MANNKTGEKVSYEVAVQRLQARLPHRHSRSPWITSQCANVIWPGNSMKPQGAALAAGKILHRAAKDGFVRWVWATDTDRHGWVIA